MKSCCNINNKAKTCKRKYDNKIFNLPRRFTKKRCVNGPVRGFTMKSSCAPFKHCQKGGRKITKTKKTKKNKKQFLYNPNDPKKSFDVYIDKDPSDTISIKYTTVNDVKKTIKKLEKLYKEGKYSHKRIWQVGMILKVRLEAMKKHKNTLYPNAKNVNQRFQLANKYFHFLKKRTSVSSDKERKKLTF